MCDTHLVFRANAQQEQASRSRCVDVRVAPDTSIFDSNGQPAAQGDLAAMIGCTRQSVNKLLGMFTDDGLLRLERDRIVILDLEGLNRTAHR